MTHNNICANDCGFATKSVLLSWSGTQKEYLYRCTKLDRIITTDSALFQVGCATYTTEILQSKQEEKLVHGDTLFQKAQELLKEIDQQIKDIQPKNVPVAEPVKPEPVSVPVPAVAIPAPDPKIPFYNPSPVIIPEDHHKKKRGRPSKQATMAEPVEEEATKV